MTEDPSHLDDTTGWSGTGTPEEDDPGATEAADDPVAERPFFHHPQWTVGMVLVFAVVFLLLGVLGHPLWLLIGSPFILTLVVWLLVRWTESRRGRVELERGDVEGP